MMFSMLIPDRAVSGVKVQAVRDNMDPTQPRDSMFLFLLS
jgi:hypothetical protein